MTALKDNMVDNMNQMLERDGKIESALAKGEELNVQTYKYKKTASATNKMFYRRKIW